MQGRTQRRLAAIVAADVVGYSRLMGMDEAGTLAALRQHRAELIDPAIAEFGGRIVKTMGDGLLLEFPSVVDAVQCALQVQNAMAARNENIAEDRRIVFRIGINLGDIIIDGDDIHGDGINIAARLEGLAEPGGICISRRVHEDVQDRLADEFADGGKQTLKNIARPVQVWRWSSSGTQQTIQEETEAQPLPDKPSIAVLPFDNMSGDGEQEYFADGITEDIITELSRFREFLVIARNSTFVYKGAAMDLTAVARELNARYIVEGSVRKAGNRVRVTAQLIEGTTNTHLWADRFDGDLTDIFALQDEITAAIVRAVAPRFVQAEVERSAKLSETQLSSWDSLLRARALLAALDRFAQRTETKPEPESDEPDSLAYTGRLFGGLIQDVRRRLPHYASDFRDGFHSKSVASTLFLFFACLAPAVTFGGIMAELTDNHIGAVEMIVASAFCGVTYALLAGQPLIILGGTDPLLVFTWLLYVLCGQLELGDYFLEVFALVGLWTGLMLLVLAATDASCLVSISRDSR